MYILLAARYDVRYKRLMQTASHLETAHDFRLFLQKELLKRCKANPKYSLRAFARLLNAEPSFVSKLLNRKRSITPALVRRFGKQLGFGPSETARYLEGLSEKQPVKSVGTSKTDYRNLSLDHFEMIADWQHYAILELVSVNGFQASFRWIATRLGITVSEARAAVERLERLEFLEITEDGRWINCSGSNTTVGNEFTAVAFRKLQKQILEMAIDALEDTPIEKRSQTSMTMAIDSSKIKEAKKRIDVFRRDLTTYLQSGSKRDGVYQLSVSLYPLTKGSL